MSPEIVRVPAQEYYAVDDIAVLRSRYSLRERLALWRKKPFSWPPSYETKPFIVTSIKDGIAECRPMKTFGYDR